MIDFFSSELNVATQSQLGSCAAQTSSASWRAATDEVSAIGLVGGTGELGGGGAGNAGGAT